VKLGRLRAGKGKEFRLKKSTMVSGVLNLFCAAALQSFVVFLRRSRYWQVYASSHH
jgi:hypothetical protein